MRAREAARRPLALTGEDMAQIIRSTALLLSLLLIGSACATDKPAIGARERDEITRRSDATAQQAEEERERKKKSGK
jgi:hypothetical protein